MDHRDVLVAACDKARGDRAAQGRRGTKMNFARACGGAAFAAVVAMTPVSSQAMSVQPVVVDMTTVGRTMSATLTVENSFTSPLPVELTVQELGFNDDGVVPTGKDPGDLLIFPPQAIIPPKGTQSFRVQWVGDPEIKQSKHYYVTVAQLPVELPEGQSGIQILYNFQTVVSVAAPGAKSALSVVSAAPTPNDGKTAVGVVVKNDGDNYDYLSRQRVSITMQDASGKKIFEKALTGAEFQQVAGFGLVGPHVQRRVVVPVELPQASGAVSVELSRDRDN
jgi:fimbrial chaperone protein